MLLLLKTAAQQTHSAVSDHCPSLSFVSLHSCTTSWKCLDLTGKPGHVIIPGSNCMQAQYAHKSQCLPCEVHVLRQLLHSLNMHACEMHSSCYMIIHSGLYNMVRSFSKALTLVC